MENNKEKLYNVVSEILGVKKSDINEKSSQDNIENWDSLKHMNLIVALEEEFEIEFDDEEIVDSMNYALIVIILKSK